MKTKTAWVAGATGFTGREVVRGLLGRGIDVIAHVRPDSLKLEEWRVYFTEMGARVDATPWELSALVESLSSVQPDLVYCLIGTTKKRMRADANAQESYESVDYGLTAMLVDATVRAREELGASPAFVYLSASGTKEGSPFAYYQARWKAEQAVLQSGLPSIIARPGVIRGDRDERRVMEEMAGVVGDAVLGVVAKLGGEALEQRYRSTSDHELGYRLVELGLQRIGESSKSPTKQIYETADLNRVELG